MCAGNGAHFGHRPAVRDRACHLWCNGQQLVHAEAPAVSRPHANGAAFRKVDRRRFTIAKNSFENPRLFGLLVHDPAMRAEHPYEPLRRCADQTRAQQQRIDRHVEESWYRAWRVVAVQCAEYEVSRQRGAYCSIRRFFIADFADENDVRVLPQERAELSREREADLLIDLGLADPVDLVFDRVLAGHYVGCALDDFAKCRVEGRGLAAAGWTGY